MTDIEQLVRRPARQAVASESTKIEQQRAIAEVQAAVLVAQQIPRDIARCMTELEQSCRQPGLAERAFYRYARAGEQVTGPSVHLAREVARCFGNIDYGIRELSRDPKAGEHGQSEMMAYAWDQQSNVRQSNTFIVPWIRHTKKGDKNLTDPRDLYENNANAGARRMREAIFSVIPKWIVEQAIDWCNDTLQHGAGDKPQAQIIADMVSAFKGLGVTQAQLETKLGRAKDEWTPPDIASLRVVWQSIRRGEATVSAEFPTKTVSVDQLTGEVVDADPAQDGEPA